MSRIPGQLATQTPQEPDDTQLAAEIRAGNTRAFEVLFRKYYEPLRRFAIGYIKSLDTADDLIQDVMLSVWQRRTQFAQHTSPVAYLHGAVRNRALNLLDHARVIRTHATTQTNTNHTTPSADTYVFASELERAAHRAIEALPLKLREVYRLRRDQGLGNEDTAAVLGITPAAVRVRMTRALQALHVTLEPFL